MELSAVTHELARIENKVTELQVRSVLMSVANGLRNGMWMWLATLVVLGGFVLVVPMPGFVRASLVGVQVVAVGWMVWRTCVGPNLFRWSRKHWALYCEELQPRLDKRLVTCLDLAAEPEGHHTFHTSPVASVLLKETAAEIALFDPSRLLPSSRMVRSLLFMVAPLMVLGICTLLAPTYVAGLFTALYKVDVPVRPLLAIHTATKAGVADITIEPGDFEVARGGTIEFAALIERIGEGELEAVPTLHIAHEEGEPEHQKMLADEENPTQFNMAVIGVEAPFKYHASIAGLNTPEYSVTLYDPPEIVRIAASANPPDYIDEPVQDSEGTFHSVHAGSRVRLTIESDQALSKAELRDGESDALPGVIDGNFAKFEFTIDDDRTFQALVFDEFDHENLEPTSIAFEAIPDKTPQIAFKRPGADWELHPIGELAMRVEIDDDHGLHDVRLEYQINDGDVQSVALMDPSEERVRGFTGEHTLQLEDLSLELGDVILYRVTARDARPDQEKASSYSQPYFLTIRPYEQDFMQSDGANAGGEAPQMPNQKEVIIATTRLIDRLPEMDESIMAERAGDTADTQRVVEDRTHIALGKMRNANVPNREARVAHLEDAIDAMQSAAEKLDTVELRSALKDENAALAHLLAAFAGLPKGVPGQGGGGGGGARMDLLGQKLDREGNKYETMDGLPTSGTRELDEAIAKTKILAQRQKEFAETIRREREQASSASGGGGGAPSSSQSKPGQQQPSPSSSQSSPARDLVNKEDMLAALEESQRELQKLKDAMLDRVEVPQEVSKDLEQALQSAAQELKRLGNAIRNEDWEEAQGANTRALEQMRSVQLQLQQAKLDAQENAVQALLAQVESWRQRQSEVSQSTAGLGKPQPGQAAPSRADVVSQQADLAQEAMAASPKVSAMTPMPNDPNPPDYLDLGDKVAKLGRDMDQVSKQIRFEQDRKAGQQQLDVLEQLDALREELEQHLGGDGTEQLREALAAVQAMRDELQAEMDRAQSGQAQGEVQDTQSQSPGNPSQSQSQAQAQSQASAPANNGPGGPGDISRIGGAPRDQRGQESWSDAGAQASPTRAFDKNAMTVQLETIANLLEPASPAQPLIRSLEQIVASDMWAPPESGAGVGDTEFIGEFAAMLDRIADIVAIELAGGDQLQRLNQAGVENLPPRFREMVSAYFESLASQAREGAPTANER